MHMCVFALCSLTSLPFAHFISLSNDFRLVISIMSLLPGKAEPWFAGRQQQYNTTMVWRKTSERHGPVQSVCMKSLT